MEPAAVVVDSLATGAAALAKGALTEAGKEAYVGLKKALLRILSPDDIESLERKPHAASRREVLAEELAEADVVEAPELVRLAQELILMLKSDATMDQATGIILEEIEAVNIRLQHVTASGAGASLKNVKAEGDIEICDVVAGQSLGKT